MTSHPGPNAAILKHAVLLIGCAACTFAWTDYRAAVRSHQRVLGDTQAVLHAVGEIRSLGRTGGAVPADIGADPPGLIQSSLAQAGIPTGSLASVTPDRVDRAGGGAHPSRRTRVELDSVSIEQATRFMVAVESIDPYSMCSALELSRAPTSSRWDASITIQRPIPAIPTTLTSLTDRARTP